MWTDSATDSLDKLKLAVTTLHLISQRSLSECDACSTSIGAVLMQDQKPLTFPGRALKGRSLQLLTYEKEQLALVLAV